MFIEVWNKWPGVKIHKEMCISGMYGTLKCVWCIVTT
jgi:hypothetical protein